LKPKSKAKPALKLDDMLVGLADAQRLIGKGETHVLMLVKIGLLKKVSRGLYRVADVAQAALKFRESEDRKSSLTEEAKRVQTARASEIELRTAKEMREVIPIEEITDFLTETIGALRSELSGVAAASTRDPLIRAEIEKNLDAAIERCRAAFGSADKAVRGRKPFSLDGEEADA